MKKDGQANQMTFSFSKPTNEQPKAPVGNNVACLQQARAAIEATRARDKENEIVSKILRASKMLNW